MTLTFDISEEYFKERLIDSIIDKLTEEYLIDFDEERNGGYCGVARHITKNAIKEYVRHYMTAYKEEYDQIVKEVVESYMEESVRAKAGLLHKAVEKALTAPTDTKEEE